MHDFFLIGFYCILLLVTVSMKTEEVLVSN